RGRGSRRDRGPELVHEADRGPLRRLRRASRPCVSGRAETDGAALLHQRRGADAASEGGVTPPLFVVQQLAGADVADVAEKLAQEAQPLDVAVGDTPRQHDDLALLEPEALHVLDRAALVEADRDDLPVDLFRLARPEVAEARADVVPGPAGEKPGRRRPAHRLGDILAGRFADDDLFEVGVPRDVAMVLVKRRAG